MKSCGLKSPIYLVEKCRDSSYLGLPLSSCEQAIINTQVSSKSITYIFFNSNNTFKKSSFNRNNLIAPFVRWSICVILKKVEHRSWIWILLFVDHIMLQLNILCYCTLYYIICMTNCLMYKYFVTLILLLLKFTVCFFYKKFR